MRDPGGREAVTSHIPTLQASGVVRGAPRGAADRSLHRAAHADRRLLWTVRWEVSGLWGWGGGRDGREAWVSLTACCFLGEALGCPLYAGEVAVAGTGVPGPEVLPGGSG